MEKQRKDRIMEMILTNETLKKQYKENPEATIVMMNDWLDAEEKGVELDPFFSRKQALEINIQELEHDLEAYKERGNIAKCELIAKEIVIKRKSLPLIGKEAEHPEEVKKIEEMNNKLQEEKRAYMQAEFEQNNLGPRL